jgi:hypothetical protein
MYHDEKAALWTAALFMAIPAFSLTGVIFTRETILLFSWTLALFLFYQAAGAPDKTSGLFVWILLGAAIGLGALASPIMLFFYLVMLICLAAPDRRPLLRTAGPYLSLAIGLCAVPIAVVSDSRLAIVSAHAEGGLLYFCAQQAVLITPLIFCLILYALHRLFYGEKGFRSVYLFAFCIPVLVFSSLACFLTDQRAGIATPGYLTGLAAIACCFFRSGMKPTGPSRAKALSAVVIYTAMAMALYITAISHFPAINRLPAGLDPVLEMRGWKDLGSQINSISGTLDQPSLVSEDCGVAAELAFYTKGLPVGCVTMDGRIVPMGTLQKSGRGDGQKTPPVIVTADNRGIPAALAAFCRKSSRKGVSVKQKGRELRSYAVFICYNSEDPQGGPGND